MKTNYRNIPDKLKKCEAFEGNSMSAFIDEDMGTYYVKSYDTIIAQAVAIGRDAEGNWDYSDCDKWVSETFYSKTTSHHQNLCRAWLPNRKFTGNIADLAQLDVTEDGRLVAR